MTARSLVLASASPARLRLLQLAGLDPRVDVSDFDERSLTATDPIELVEQLAVAKARVVAGRCCGELVLGCDSMLAFEGEVWGRAVDADEVVARWQRFRGREGQLLTGHCLIDTADDNAMVSAVGVSTIRFGSPGDDELRAYATTDEALRVAGPFTIDGRAAAFVESIDGNAGNVIGVSLPLVRELLAKLNVRLTDLWL
ncbi:MAG: nucleoside triphosphate pyrophosphatase [Mycobacteriales bacterium]